MKSLVLVLGAHQPVRRDLSWTGQLTQSALLWASGAEKYLAVWVRNHNMRELHLAYTPSCWVDITIHLWFGMWLYMGPYLNLYHNQHTNYIINLSCLESLVRSGRKYPFMPLCFRRFSGLRLICFVQRYLQHTHAPYWPRLHNMGGWTAAIHTPLSAMAPSVTLTVMRVSGWEEHHLWHATTQATGVGIYPPASVSAQHYLKLTSFVFLFWCSDS